MQAQVVGGVERSKRRHASMARASPRARGESAAGSGLSPWSVARGRGRLRGGGRHAGGRERVIVVVGGGERGRLSCQSVTGSEGRDSAADRAE